MALPRTKAELSAVTARQRDALAALLAGLTREQMMWPGAYGWSAKDHVAHLTEWERMFFGWYEAGLRGEEPPVPAEGYTWATMDALNQRIYDQHRDEQLEHVLADWRETSRQLIAGTEAISELSICSAPADSPGPDAARWRHSSTSAAPTTTAGLRWRSSAASRPGASPAGTDRPARSRHESQANGSPADATDRRERRSWAISAPPTIPALLRNVARAMGVLTVRY